MSVRKVLAIFGGHLSPETWRRLAEHEDEQTTDAMREPGNTARALIASQALGALTPYGWLIYANETPIPLVPDDLATIMRHAHRQGCQYVLIDFDAVLPTEGLPILSPRPRPDG